MRSMCLTGPLDTDLTSTLTSRCSRPLVDSLVREMGKRQRKHEEKESGRDWGKKLPQKFWNPITFTESIERPVTATWRVLTVQYGCLWMCLFESEHTRAQLTVKLPEKQNRCKLSRERNVARVWSFHTPLLFLLLTVQMTDTYQLQYPRQGRSSRAAESDEPPALSTCFRLPRNLPVYSFYKTFGSCQPAWILRDTVGNYVKYSRRKMRLLPNCTEVCFAEIRESLFVNAKLLGM